MALAVARCRSSSSLGALRAGSASATTAKLELDVAQLDLVCPEAKQHVVATTFEIGQSELTCRPNSRAANWEGVLVMQLPRQVGGRGDLEVERETD